MKFMFVLVVCALMTLSAAVSLAKGPHNHKTDNAFLTRVFKKWTQLGVDGEGDINGKRVLTAWTAKWAAKDILGAWMGYTKQ